MVNFITVMSYGILIYFALLTVAFSILLMCSVPDILQQYREEGQGKAVKIIDPITTRPIISVIVPIYNEKRRVLDTVTSILKSDHAPINIILVNDGSTDNTLDILKSEYELYEVPLVIKQTIPTKSIYHAYQSELFPNIMVIDKEHGFGNAGDSVNVGLNACTTPLMMTVDADTIVESQSISLMLYAFFSKPHCVTVGGSVNVLNGITFDDGILGTPKLPTRLIPAYQAVEYIRSFLFGRAGWNSFHGALSYAGAFTLFEKQVLMEVGGFDAKNFAYDAEIVTKIHDYMRTQRFPYTVVFTPNAFSWTVVPDKLKAYWRQRNFWQRGLLKTFFLHKHLFFNPRYGLVGLFSVPFNLFFEILAPVVEFISFLLVIIAIVWHVLALTPVIWALLLAIGFSTFINLANFYLNIITYKHYHGWLDPFKVIYVILIEILGFRQFRNACYFLSTWHYFWNRLVGRYL